MGAGKKRSDPDSMDVDRPKRTRDEADESSSDEDMDIVDVDFEWFDPQPETDFHGLKTLLRQLLDIDAELFDLSGLADLILSQPLLGSTVKVDGKESDPFAFLSVINFETHKDHPAIAPLIAYLTKHAKETPSLSPLATLLSQSPIPPIGLILTERLLNVPPAVIPPMYTMLLEEIAWALEESEPYSFTHYLILSKVYEEIESALDTPGAERPSKKTKKGGKSSSTTPTSGELFYFHPEDEVFAKSAVCKGEWVYEKPVDEGAADSRRAFQEMGIRPKASVMLFEKDGFEKSVKDVAEFLGSEA